MSFPLWMYLHFATVHLWAIQDNKKKNGKKALVVIKLVGGTENNVTVRPGYVMATTLKPGYLRTAH